MPFPATKLFVTTWLALVGTGMGLLVHHGNVAGTTGRVPTVLPDDLGTRLGWRGDRPLVVLFAHPQCPCLPSSLGELTRALAGAPAVDLRLAAFVPSAPPPSWDPAALQRLREAAANGTTLEDRDGRLAARLGAETSGHVLVYGTDRTLRFSGGVTAGRAHVGDNAAARTLGKTLSQNSTESARTAVFGCPFAADDGPTNGSSCCAPE